MYLTKNAEASEEIVPVISMLEMRNRAVQIK
jgi:hypothetical protein